VTRLDTYSDAHANALAERERPYSEPHDVSQARRQFAPKGLPDLVRWFVRAWRAEIPEPLHGGGVERQRPGRIVRGDHGGVTDGGGGSRLGTPSWTTEFRHIVEVDNCGCADCQSDKVPTDSRREFAVGYGIEVDSYATPLRWTIAWLEQHRHPLIAAVLRYIGRNDGSYEGLSLICGGCESCQERKVKVLIPDEYAEAIAERALGLAAKHYREEPEPRIA
jgi:hypothetical protein